ncbi:MAG: hypothetical protein Q9227_004890 [Pyrenula ochraceoflavens]
MEPTSPQCFGLFGRLPLEIRWKIWDNLVTLPELIGRIKRTRAARQRDDDFPPLPGQEATVPKRYAEFSIMRANSVLYEEVAQRFHSTLVLSFHLISPEDAVPSLSSDTVPEPLSITVRDRHDSPVYKLPLSAFYADEESGIWHFPFHKLKAIRFVLIAPRADDPGELVRTFMVATRLVELLQRCATQVPEVRIEVQETAERSWQGNCGLPGHPVVRSPYEQSTSTNLELALKAFALLRQIPRISVSIPESLMSKELSGLKKGIENWAVLQRPLATARPIETLSEQYLESEQNDEDKQDLEDEQDLENEQDLEDEPDERDERQITNQSDWYLWLEHRLDSMKGPTAAFLRLERLAHWSPEYGLKLVRHMYGHHTLPPSREWSSMFGACSFVVQQRCHCALQKSIIRRYWESAIFNPMGTEYLSCSPKSWQKTYPLGIPAYHSAEYNKKVKDYYCRHKETIPKL